MKTKAEILKSQLLHDNIPFSNKTFEKDWGYVLEAMEEYANQKPADDEIKQWVFEADPVRDNDSEWDYGFRQGKFTGAKAMRDNLIK